MPRHSSSTADASRAGRRGFVTTVAVLALASLALIYGAKLTFPPIRSDGVGYDLYIPASLIDRDLSLRATTDRSFDGRVPEDFGVNRTENSGRLFIKYPLGVALLLTPFALVAHAAAYAFGADTNGFSPPYQAAVALGGVFFWSPVLALAVAGFFLLRRSRPEYVVPVLIFMPLNTWVITSWHDWAYGGSFGHRAFTESITLFAFGYAALLQAASPAMGRLLRSVSVGCIALSTWLMMAYCAHAIPYDRTTWAGFTRALWPW